MKSDTELKKGYSYSVVMYTYSPEEQGEYYKDDMPCDAFSILLTPMKKGENVKTHIIVYQEG